MSKKQVNINGQETIESHPRRKLKEPEPAKTIQDRSRELIRIAQDKRKNKKTEQDIESF